MSFLIIGRVLPANMGLVILRSLWLYIEYEGPTVLEIINIRIDIELITIFVGILVCIYSKSALALVGFGADLEYSTKECTKQCRNASHNLWIWERWQAVRSQYSRNTDIEGCQCWENNHNNVLADIVNLIC
nr:MAG TPA: hypothetical protein [Caudoviricetes sp.]